MGQEYISCYIVQEYILDKLDPFPENIRIGAVFLTISEKDTLSDLLKI